MNDNENRAAFAMQIPPACHASILIRFRGATNDDFELDLHHHGDEAASIVLRGDVPRVALNGQKMRASWQVQDGGIKPVWEKRQVVRTSSIVGTVTRAGKALSGALVTISGTGRTVSKRSDANGQYAFTGLRAGGYIVEAVREGSRLGQMQVTVDEGESVVASFGR